jgi:hypothetical protein
MMKETVSQILEESRRTISRLRSELPTSSLINRSPGSASDASPPPGAAAPQLLQQSIAASLESQDPKAYLRRLLAEFESGQGGANGSK